MVSIRYLVAIQGCDPNPGRNPGRNLCSRTFQGFRFEIATLIATLAIFYGFDYGFGFDRNLRKVFPGRYLLFKNLLND